MRKYPQTIAHRGKSKHPDSPNPRLSRYPENTLEAFTAAAQSGCDAIETDLHISKDGVIVLCHDRWLERSFGVRRFVEECEWAELAMLRSVQVQSESESGRMPRLVDFLEWLGEPQWEELWVLLDIKLDNSPARIIPLLTEAFASVPSKRPWAERVVLGCWSSAYFPLCEVHLPSFEVALIVYDLRYAREVLRTSRGSFNVHQKVLMGMGRGFLEEARAAGRRVFVWTVNEPSLMRWSIDKEVDGVITDDPVRYRAILQDIKQGVEPEERITVSQKVQAWAISLLVVMFGWLFRRKFLSKMQE